MSATQHITATLVLSDDQDYEISTHGDGQRGSHIGLLSQSAMVWLYDQAAVDTYAAAWLTDPAELRPINFPTERVMALDNAAEYYPTLAIHAHGSDRTGCHYNPTTGLLTIRVGWVSWRCFSRTAYERQAAAWRKIVQLAPIVLPRWTPSDPRPTGRRR